MIHPILKNIPLALSAVLACCCLSANAQEQRAPNVIFILADDLGWRDTAVYGSSFYETPHIDALAQSGMRFTDAYSANPLCSPTRASILTGQYPVRYGLTDATGHIKGIQEHKERTQVSEEIRAAGPMGLNYLDSKDYTLGKAMRDAGYATGFFGKWHMGCTMEHYPESHGFD
ncbi:MAG: sulfatase-like hydrolase/transferase, partial [Coraliomargarita sp.]